MANQPRLRPGDKLGPYQIVRLIEGGGMGEVYEAYDVTTNRRAALKIVSATYANDVVIVKRFLAEGQMLSRISHPNVVSMYSWGEESDTPYLAMEFVAGQSLDKMIRGKPMTWDFAMPLFRQIVAGAHALHVQGIIHRDIKPKNILVDPNGALKLVDFGIAKFERSADSEITITSAGVLVGSLSYLAPEIIKGQTASVQSDIWSMGVVLYEMLVGEHPFQGDDPQVVANRIIEDPLNFGTAHAKNVPIELRQLILKMCEKHRDRRFSSALHVLRELESFANRQAKLIATNEISTEEEGGTKTEILVESHNSEDDEDGEAIALEEAIEPHKAEPNLFASVPVATYSQSAKTEKIAEGSRPVTKPTARESSKRRIWPTVATLSAALALVWSALREQLPLVENGSTPSTAPATVHTAKPPEAPQPLTLRSPEANQELWVAEEELIEFDWVGGTGQPQRLQVATDTAFSNPIIDQSDLLPPFSTGKISKEGVYYWRVGDSTPIRFELVKKNPPHLAAPKSDAEYKSGESVRLEWKGRPPLQYRWEVASDPNFNNTLRSEITAEPSASVANLPPGTYYWRVRAESPGRGESVWSAVRRFQIGNPISPLALARKTLPAPSSLTGPREVKLRFKTRDSRSPTSQGNALNPPTLAWRPVKGAIRYEVQVAKSTSFDRPVWTGKSAQPTAKWLTATPGQYHWRVRAVGRGDKPGAYSAPKSLSVK